MLVVAIAHSFSTRSTGDVERGGQGTTTGVSGASVPVWQRNVEPERRRAVFGPWIYYFILLIIFFFFFLFARDKGCFLVGQVKSSI